MTDSFIYIHIKQEKKELQTHWTPICLVYVIYQKHLKK